MTVGGLHIENEAKVFFELSQDVNRAGELTDKELLLLLEEIESMRRHAYSPIIRQRCAALLSQFEDRPANASPA